MFETKFDENFLRPVTFNGEKSGTENTTLLDTQLKCPFGHVS